MRYAVSYGLGCSVTGDGNGLKQLADHARLLGHDVQIFSALDTIRGSFDRLIGHSYGAAQCIKFAKDNPSQKMKLILIDPVVRCWYLRPWVFATQWQIPANVETAICYYTKSFPPSCKIKNEIPGRFTNIMLPEESHVSIVRAVVERILREEARK